MTNLLLLRESAKFIKTSLGYSGTEIVRRDACGDIIADYILETIDPEPEAAITTEWLKEEWGAIEREGSDCILIGDINGNYTVMLKHRGGLVMQDAYMRSITTRQQFCDLARCLGIPKQKAKLEQSNESCGKCGKKLKQTKKGVQYCECWMPQPPERSV